MLLGLGGDNPKDSYEEQSYAESCLNGFTFALLFDRFFVVHLLGFFVMAFSIRNFYLTWMVSVGFEFIELSLSKWLPNFNECFYDR